MTEHTERHLTVDELRVLVLSCAACDGKIRIDVGNDKQRGRFRLNESTHALVCPLCLTPFDPGYRQAVQAFWNFREQVVKDGLRITFSVGD